MGALEDRKVKKYKKYWDERASHDKIAREKLRRQALKVSQRLGEILISDFHAKKVVLFGSILDKDGFREGSDIDMAVEGLPAELYFAALGRLIMESPFDIDLKPIEEVSPLLKQRIEKGKVLFERK
ncbi:MAG: hypothetical protein A2077_05815 [Nitrospirae bacterium GWC2_46_6]|nr:MAG: hypothetical protein A2077_05815 [Nitrospirae bacterium GWC2_46_6]OGW19954.1 MAG: hypothetical protein A2Z82_03040 [Nitrospirae bacterium GWA2_46_11]OGW25544.1 MAG: hypothetical protein A2X55_11300 [Nitrospirae bacterium GWB2_47_37]HAK89101.1 DNA polymerase subunit beta [Nitrospiraceae bacterium]HCL80851.1 DNA polymerase subunit beta [Nitrospiraceae bacterium]